MPVYKNTSDIKQKVSGVVFEPNEEKTTNCYLYDKDLEMISNLPAPQVVTHSGLFELDTDEEIELDLENTEECLLDIIVQAPEGGVSLHHNATENHGIIFKGVYQDRISSKYLNRLIIKATKDGVSGSYFVKKNR